MSKTNHRFEWFVNVGQTIALRGLSSWEAS
jgi:hypothetical protein